MPVITPAYSTIFNLVGDVDKITHAAWAAAVEAALASVPSLPIDNTQLASAASGTVKANITGGAAFPVDVTLNDFIIALALEAGDITGLGPLANVTEVANADLADMADATVKANISGSAAPPSDVSLANFSDTLRLFSQDVRGQVPGPNAVAVANGYVLHADGTWAVVSGPGLGDVVGPAGAVTDAVALFDGVTGKIVKAGPVFSATGQSIATAASAHAARAVIGGPDTNLLINGDFQINQRGFAGGSLAAGSYGFDRWKADGATANISVAGAVVTLSSGKITQVVEPPEFGYPNLASTAVTVSVDTPSAAMTLTVNGQTASIAAGAGRRSATITLTGGDTGNITVSLNKTTAGTVTFGRVKMEVGSVATPWVARAAASERLLCWRYFQRHKSIMATAGHFMGARAAANIIRFYLPMLTEMRAAPTLSHSAPTWAGAAPSGNQVAAVLFSTNAFVTITGALTFGSIALATNSASIVLSAGTSFSGVAGDFVAFAFGTGAYVDFSAEL